MTNAQRFYSIAKANHASAAKQAASAFEIALARTDITDAERSFLNRSVASAKASTFPDFHPGEW